MQFLLIILIRFGKGHSPKKRTMENDGVDSGLLSIELKLLQFLFKMKKKISRFLLCFLNEMKMLLVFDSFWMMYWHLHSALLLPLYAMQVLTKESHADGLGRCFQMSQILMMVTLDYKQQQQAIFIRVPSIHHRYRPRLAKCYH